MAEYYLISQLPSLDGMGDNVPLPITEERFTELCRRFLSNKARDKMERLTLSPSRYGGSSDSVFIDAWNESERNLRLALGKARAEKMKKAFTVADKILPVECMKAANTAVDMQNPMEAEVYLTRYRLEQLEALRPMDGFSEEYIFYYGLKLKLLYRMRQFDAQAGEEAYQKIYRSILSGDRLEAVL